MLIILYTMSFKALVILLLIIASLTVYIYRKYVSNWKQITQLLIMSLNFLIKSKINQLTGI